MSEWNASTIAEFRANEGRIGGYFEGAPVSCCITAAASTPSRRGVTQAMPSTPAELLESAPSLCSNSDGHSAPGCTRWQSVRGPCVAVETQRVARRTKTTGRERWRPPSAASPIENKTTEEYG